MLFDAFLEDGYLPPSALEKLVVEGMCKVELGLFIFVQTLVGLTGVLILGCVILSLVLGGVMTQGECK